MFGGAVLSALHAWQMLSRDVWMHEYHILAIARCLMSENLLVYRVALEKEADPYA